MYKKNGFLETIPEIPVLPEVSSPAPQPKTRRRRLRAASSAAGSIAAVLFTASVGMIVSVIVLHHNDKGSAIVSFEASLDLPSRHEDPPKAIIQHDATTADGVPKITEHQQRPNRTKTALSSSSSSSVVTTPPVDDSNDHHADEAVFVAQDDDASTIIETCFPHNSKEWLEGPRLGNAHDDPLILTEDFAVDMILNTANLLSGGTMHTLLNRTICHEQSRFLNWTDDGSDDDDDGDDNKTLHFWALRLLYLAFHVHQHQPAMKEAAHRRHYSNDNTQRTSCDLLLKQYGIGNFDYECPDTKFLIVPMGELGLGAVMRLGAVNGLVAGMATNRTVLFINNAPAGDKSVQKPWVHASCDRKDVQCFFLPPSPCVLTHREIEEAYVMQRGETRRMFRFGELPEAHARDRALIVNIVLRPQRTPETLRSNLKNVSQRIIDEMRRREANDDRHDARLDVMEKAADLILEEEPPDESRPYYYFGAQSKLHHAAVFYSMRPKPSNAVMLDQLTQNVLPNNFDPELALGLPVRASDKCLMESECLSFPQYMKLMGQVWKKNEASILDTAKRKSLPANFNTSIVLTTESESIYRDKSKFESDPSNQQSVPFPYQFVSNDHDVRQGTGLPTNFAKHTATADEIMMSAISSLKTQLMARFTVGNCCSNFHLLLFDFLRDGCGAARDNVGQCLQENEDPEFRVCCMWSKTDECIAKKNSTEAQT